MSVRVALLVVAAVISLAAVPASAEVSRTCSGRVTAHANGKSEIIANINGVGFCRNQYHANDCRIRARKAVEACLAALSPADTANAPPIQCRSFAGGGRPYAALTYEGIFPIANSQRYLNRLAHSACCRMARNRDFVTVKVSAEKWGKNHCAGRRVGPDHYEDDDVFMHGPVNFDCRKRRAEGICG